MSHNFKSLLITGGIGATGKALYVTDNKISEFLSVANNEIYGITQANGFYYVALRSGQPRILKLDSNLKVVFASLLPQSADPHCIYVEDSLLHVVSSSEDLIYQFALDLDFVGRTRFGLGMDKRFHVNDVTKIGSEFFVSMFTDKQDGRWNDDIGQGFVKSASHISPLDMKIEMLGLCKPHNPTLFNDDLWVCDSGRGAVWCNNTKVYQDKYAWSRGLCVEQEFIHTGMAHRAKRNGAQLITLTKTGDVARKLTLPLDFIYGIQVI